MRRVPLVAIVVLLMAVPAVAVTPQEIVAMKKVGVSDAVLLAVIERDQTIFTLDANDLVQLQRDGISEPVILAMLRSGRQEPAAAAAPAPMPGPPPTTGGDAGNFAIVGHDPDTPGGAAPYVMYYSAPYYSGPAFYDGYYGVASPFFFPGARRHRGRAVRGTGDVFTNPSGPFLNDPMRRFENPIVTIPPPVGTRHRR